MSSKHKYKIGEELRLASGMRKTALSANRCRIVGYRPFEQGEPSYRIKSDLENHERIVRESELT